MPWEVIRYLQFRPTHVQNGQKGVTSVYPGHSDSLEKPPHRQFSGSMPAWLRAPPKLEPQVADQMRLEHNPAW